MDISEVRVKLVNNPKDRLKAFCSITLEDDFVIRDLKIIDGANGTFVAMPSRKLADRCQRCGHKNHLRAKYCNECGGHVDATRNAKVRRKLHADIAHPINSACRERIQGVVVDAYKDEIEKSKEPGYKPARFDDFDDYEDYEGEGEPMAAPIASESPTRESNTRESATREPATRQSENADGQASEQERDSKPRKGRNYDNGGGYNDLIADLKRDAKARRPEPRSIHAFDEDEQDHDDGQDHDDNQDHDDVQDREEVLDQVVEIDESEDGIEEVEEVVETADEPLVAESREPAQVNQPTANQDFGAGLL